MEKFTWLNQLQIDACQNLTLATGPGFVTMKPTPGAYGTVAEILDGAKPGFLVSSTALLSLVAGEVRRYVLLKRSADAAIAPGLWQFPAGRCDPHELPLQTAARELNEEIRIDGEVSDWSGIPIRVGGNEVTYLTDDTIHEMRARYVMSNNSVEFYYPMELQVSDFEAVQLSDNEYYEREVRLLSLKRISELYEAGMLTEATALIFKKHLCNASEPQLGGTLS